MGINVTHTMSGFQFESKENLRNTAKNILTRQGADKQAVERITGESIFDGDSKFYTSAQSSMLKASAQISINNTLSETLKYLKAHSNKKIEKSPVFGELWNSFNENETKENEFEDIVVDFSNKNIFAAA